MTRFDGSPLEFELLPPDSSHVARVGGLALVGDALTDQEINLAVVSGGFTPSLLAGVDRALQAVLDPGANTYQYHFYNSTCIDTVAQGVSESLLGEFSGIGEGVARALGSQIQELTGYMSELGADLRPFVSLRTVNRRYVGGCVCGGCRQCLGRNPSVSRDWHVDSARHTLTATLAGSPTQFTLNENVDRGYFSAHKIMRPQDGHDRGLNDPALTFGLPHTSLAILKGELRTREDNPTHNFFRELGLKDPGTFNEGQGLVHRGGQLAGPDDIRMVLTVSTY
jgi:hypothetical protein